jgi:hypothetical protein
MIDKREILEAATRMSLNPHVVEKDSLHRRSLSQSPPREKFLGF